jgi:hypothetical protein
MHVIRRQEDKIMAIGRTDYQGRKDARIERLNEAAHNAADEAQAQYKRARARFDPV